MTCGVGIDLGPLDPTDGPAPKTPDPKALIASLQEANEIWAVVSRGLIAFRFGPFTKEEVGPLMDRAVEEGVEMAFIFHAGTTIEWEAMKEFAPADFQQGASDAP